MKKYQELHRTIHSMDGHEVRYFKLFAKRHVIGEGNTYLELFDAIRKQDTCSDNELKQIFSQSDFVRHLPSAKLYLLRLINKSLYHYHDKEDDLSVILRHIKLSELFYTKGEFELAESNLKKAKRAAEKEEAFVFSLLISELQLKLSVSLMRHHKNKEAIAEEMANEKEMFRKYLNLREYLHALARFKALEQITFIPSTFYEKRQYDKIIQQPLFQNPTYALSDKARSIYYEIRNSYDDKIKDKLQKQEISDELLDFFIEHPRLFRKNASSFINATDEYLKECYVKKDHERFLTGLKKFKALEAPTKVLQAQIIYRSGSIELRYLFENGKSAKIQPYILETEKLLRKHVSAKDLLLHQFYFELSCWFCLSKKYREALKWNLKINYSEKHPNKPDFLSKSQLLNSLIHLRLGNTDYLLSRIQSEKRKGNSPKNKLFYYFIPLLEQILNRSPRAVIKLEFDKLHKKNNEGRLIKDALLRRLIFDTQESLFLSH